MATRDELAWQADVLVIFGITGDLARKMTLPALYRLARRGALDCPVIGVAAANHTTQEFLALARQAIEAAGERVDDAVFGRLARRLTYVPGDVSGPELYKTLDIRLAATRQPLYYLAVPPSLFAPIVDRLDAVWRVVSFPATASSRKNEAISSSVSRKPSTSAETRLVIRSCAGHLHDQRLRSSNGPGSRHSDHRQRHDAR